MWQHNKKKSLTKYYTNATFGVIRITSWLFRSITNCKNKEKLSGPLDTAETEKAKLFWIKHEQEKTEKTDNFKEDQNCLNLRKNNAGISNVWEEFKASIHYKFHGYQFLLRLDRVLDRALDGTSRLDRSSKCV